MRTTSLAEVRTQLSKFVDEVAKTHEAHHHHQAKNRKPAAVLISADKVVKETLFWANQGARDESGSPSASRPCWPTCTHTRAVERDREQWRLEQVSDFEVVSTPAARRAMDSLRMPVAIAPFPLPAPATGASG